MPPVIDTNIDFLQFKILSLHTMLIFNTNRVPRYLKKLLLMVSLVCMSEFKNECQVESFGSYTYDWNLFLAISYT